MPNNNVDSWAQRSDGTRDWKAIFENPEKGLIALVDKAETPAQLKKSMLTVIAMLFTRKADGAMMEKYTSLVEKIVPENGEADKLDDMKPRLVFMLHDIKEKRERKVAEYQASQKVEKKGDRRTPSAAKKFATPPLSKSRWQTIFAVWAILATLAAGGLGSFLFFGSKGDIGGQEEARWVRQYVSAHLSADAWKVMAVKPSPNPTFEIRVLMIDHQYVRSIKAMEAAERTVFLKEVCPPPQVSKIRELLDQGWRFRVLISGPEGKLTEGWCPLDNTKGRIIPRGAPATPEGTRKAIIRVQFE